MRLMTLAVAILATLTLPPAFAETPRQDMIRVAITGEPQGTLPTIHFHAPGKMLVQHVAETLVAYRNDLSIAPALADSWSTSDAGLVYRFTVREGARFHNGEPVLAEHVASNWRDLYLNPDFDWDCRAYFDGSGSITARTSGVDIKEVVAVDNRTVEFRLRRANSLFLHRLADVSCGPVAFHPDSFADDGQWNSLIGSGPYKLSHAQIGQQIDLVRFADYLPRTEPRDAYGGARIALLDTVRLQVYPSTADAVAALQSGDVDYVQGISASERNKVLSNPDLAAATTSNVTYWTLLMQTSDKVLDDVALRRGIAKAIDRDRIALAVSGNRVSGHASAISKQSTFYSKAQEKRNGFDPRDARELVDSSEYTGETITIQCSRDTYEDSCLIAEMAQSMMREVGINAEVWPMSWKKLKDDRYQTGRYQMQAFIIGGRTTPTLAYGKFIGNKASNPRFYWENERAFALVQDAEAADSDKEMQTAYDRLHRMMLDDVPQVVIMNREHHDAYRVGFAGIQPTHFGRISFWGVSGQQTP